MTNSDLFRDYGYAYIREVLTKQQCDDFSNIMLEMKQNQNLRYEGGENSFYTESFGGNHPDFEKALREVQPRIENELNIKMAPANSFGRIYYNGGTLNPHKDRPGLDYTLSITLRSTLDKDWPLWLTDKQGNNLPLHIAEGDGGIMYGTGMTHWRDPLVCAPEQYAIKLFFHWSFV